MDRVQLKEYCKAKVSGKRIVLWKALIFIFVGSIFTSMFTVWFEPTTYGYYYSMADLMVYVRSMAITTIITMFLTKPLEYGINQYMMDFDKDEFVDNNVLFAPYRKIIKIFVLSLFIAFVCAIPMIVLSLFAFIAIEFLPFAIFMGMLLNFYLSLHFVAVPYIFNENKELSIIEIMKLSSKMMRGHKMDYFVLTLSFFGWALLTVATCGILYIWLLPYSSFTFAKFFLNIKEAYYGFVQEDEDTFTVG